MKDETKGEVSAMRLANEEKTLLQLMHEDVSATCEAKGLSMAQLAERVGVNTSTLYSRVEETNGPLAKDLRLLESVLEAAQTRMLREVLRRHGMQIVTMPASAGVAENEGQLMGMCGDLLKETGEAIQKLNEARQDGQLTAQECAECLAQLEDVNNAVFHIMAWCRRTLDELGGRIVPMTVRARAAR